MNLGHQHTRYPASCYTRSLSDMIDTNATNIHTVQLSSVQLDVIVEALSGYADARRPALRQRSRPHRRAKPPDRSGL